MLAGRDVYVTPKIHIGRSHQVEVGVTKCGVPKGLVNMPLRERKFLIRHDFAINRGCKKKSFFQPFSVHC